MSKNIKGMNPEQKAAHKATHARAVSYRKMTDEQLCAEFDAQYNKGRSEGMNEGALLAQQAAAKPQNEEAVIAKFIDWLEGRTGSGNGIGGGTIFKLRKELANAVSVKVIGGGAS
jgi:hypothetical protein